MEEEVRRSSRANKGQHTGRDLFDVYYQPEDEPAAKRQKQDTEYDQEHVSESDDDHVLNKAAESDGEDYEGDVRCDPCGTTQDNYNEDTDEGGMMIECDDCHTWQHAKCMGFRNEGQIPEKYRCNRCVKPKPELRQPVKRRPLPEKKAVQKPKSAASKTRESVEKALMNVIAKHGKFEAGPIAQKLEEAIYQWSGMTPNKKYIDKSRSVMALMKKATVAGKLADGSLTFLDAVSKPPEEIDRELKEYAEKVRQESIRRSVLTVEDPLSQRIRRTHKGEEVVEFSNNPLDAEEVTLVARTVDHRNFKEESPTARETVKSDPLAPKMYHLADDDDDDDEKEEEKAEDDNGDKEDAKKSHDISDDELDFILQGPTPAVAEKPKSPVVPKKSALKLPPTMPVNFWKGDIVFPDFADFGCEAEFISCTNYEKPKNNVTVSFHNRVVRVSKEMLERQKYNIEGRLDRSRADPYLSKITSSRDLYVVKLNPIDRRPQFDKLFDYLLQKNKVGVLSNRAPFVKDAYVFALNTGNVPEYLKFAQIEHAEGLYGVFVVKKDYIPVGKSILKKTPLAAAPPVNPPASLVDLNSILLKLSGFNDPPNGGSGPPGLYQQMSHLPPIPQQQGQDPNTQNLSQDQLRYLSDLVNQNPQAQQNPQALLSMLQQAEQGGRQY